MYSNAASAVWRSLQSDDLSDAPVTSGRVVLLIEGNGNRQQIHQQLSHNHVIVSPDESRLMDGDFDIAIVDGPGLVKWHDALHAAKSSMQPVFLPVMQILPVKELRNRPRAVAGIIDDFVTSPIDLAEFLERIARLLKTRRQALEQHDELVRLVNYDRTTGLPNRQLFTETLESTLRSAKSEGVSVSVLAIHLPLAKILETIGATAAEQAALSCSELLQDLVGEELGLGRLSMEKWVVELPPDISTEQILGFCSRIDQLAVDPIRASNESLRIEPRIGVSVYPDDVTTASELIDAAIASSSRAQTGMPAFFASARRHAALEYLRTESQLHHALADEQFELWLQPKLALQTGQVRSVEALIRWRLPSGEMVPPGKFIPVAESCDLIYQITRWVIKTAVRMVAEWNNEIRIAVNITPGDIQRADFLPSLERLCAAHGVSPQSIELELTETMICDMDEVSVAYLRKLRDAGFKISIDDFGTGYSSLGYLHQLPVHQLKIDKSFIDNVPGDSNGAVVTRAVINLAREFDLEIVAEGIETKPQLDYLRKAGVDYGQGFYIARPMPANDLCKWLEEWDLTGRGNYELDKEPTKRQIVRI
ncbi:MAG: EAL domain-containing protein [Pseudohongiellaceae bacterium]